MSTPETKKLLNHYLRRLTNLSGNNRSLYLGRIASEQFMDLHLVSQLNRETSFSIIAAVIAEKRKIVCPVVDPRLEASNEVSRKLRKLQRLDHFLFEERGSRDLHIGWPFVRGKLSDGTAIRCPLLFLPVQLDQDDHHWVIRPREGAEITFNKTFLLAYSFYNEVKLEESLLEENFEDTDRDSTVFRTALYQLITKGALNINFNADNYRDELTSFVNYKKDEFEEQHHNGELKLFPEAVLGIFPQAGSYLVPDYFDLLDNDRIADLEDFFQSRNTAPPVTGGNFISQIKEERVYAAFPMDVWQENALKAVKLGNSVVVQGPPGTGKSQLICNLISDSISHGKRVMVVCQKRAALDVVYARLKAKRLSPFVALVHDFRNDRKVIYEKIAAQIDLVDDYKVRNNSLDSIQMERGFYQASRTIDQITEELEEFKSALFDESECGTSVKELYLRSDPAAASINLKQEYQYFSFEHVPVFLAKLKGYAFYADRFDQAAYPWRERRSFAGFTLSDYQKLAILLKEIPAYFQAVLDELHKVTSARLNWVECELLVERKADAEELLKLVNSPEKFSQLQAMMPEPEEETSALWLSNIERVIRECYLGDGPEVTVPPAQLGQFQVALQRSMKARRNLFSMVRWELFSKDKIFITRVLVANGLKSNKTGLQTLEKKLDNRLNLEHNLSKLKSKKWLQHLPEGYKLEALQKWMQLVQHVIKAKEIYFAIRGLRTVADPIRLTWKTFTKTLGEIFRLLDDVPLKKAVWLNYLTPSQVVMLTQKENPASEWAVILKNDFDALVEFDQQTEALSPDERSIILKLNQQAETWNYAQLQQLLVNSWSLAWIEHIETKHPVLRIVSSGKVELLEAALREQIREKQKINDEILLLRARERVTDHLEFNRLNNLVTYRDLYHQVTKKKRIWPLRKTIADFEDEIYRVVPCWLVSPETVSTIFPMKEIFDLVIFDEASQCFAERGIPAMYRGKQVVVAGDDQQLRPNDLYQVRWQEEDVEHPDQEVDSLLDLCSRYLLKVDLRSHYRSQELPLIDFSNRHFYKGRLQLLPDRHAVNRPEPPIRYVKLEGKWVDNVNEAEAQKVTEIVFDLLNRSPQKSIGIVTFNSPQQNLILDMLEDQAVATGTALPPNLFVKNIENVQGDEKDIIIFSVAYASGKKSKVGLQFGSLSQLGGENRLNVAITRAREMIIVVTSIWPEELHVDDAAHRGPKLLRAYLDYARSVSEGAFVPFVHRDGQHAESWYLKTKIRSAGLSKYVTADIMVNHFPLADLTVVSDNQYLGIILTDDDNYFNSLSVKERHASLPELLEQKNWKYLGQFSRNYWHNEDKFVNEVGKFVTP